MLKLLLKKQLLEIFQVYYYDAKKNKARSRVSTVLHFLLFALLIFGLLGGIFTFLAVKLCTPLLTAGMDWLYFALMGLISVLLGDFGSVFNTYAGVYLPKDNDLLLSMPIPVSALVGARLAGVYLMGLLYSAIVILPAVLVYWLTAGVTLPAVLGGLLLTLLISVFVLTISCMLGWVVARISQKLKHKSLITVLVSLAVLCLYYFVYFKAQTLIQQLLANAAVYGTRIKGAAYPVYLFGSVGVGDVKASIIVSAAVAVLFGLMWLLLSHSFLQIATAAGKVARREYRETRSRQRSTSTALLCREFSRFAASPSLYAQLRSWHLSDAGLRNCGAVEGQGTVCRAGCHLCGNARQRTLPVVCDALQSCLHELYDRTFGILGGEKPLAAAISPGRAMEGLSGKNQDAAPFDRFAAAVVHRMHGGSLSLASDAASDASSFCRLLYATYGTGRSVLWR